MQSCPADRLSPEIQRRLFYQMYFSGSAFLWQCPFSPSIVWRSGTVVQRDPVLPATGEPLTCASDRYVPWQSLPCAEKAAD